MNRPKLGLLLLLLAALGPQPALAAWELAAGGGFSLGSGEVTGLKTASLLLGAELTYGLSDVIQVGGFYDHNVVSYDAGGSDALKFYGGVARLGFGPLSNFFVDLKLGFESFPVMDTAFGWGLGGGYRHALGPATSLRPRIGYRSLPASFGGISFSRGELDFEALVSFSL